VNSTFAQDFNFSKILFDPPSTLSVQIHAINYETGNIAVTGYDSRAPSIPFTWEWGDGSVNEGYFPQNHHYTDNTKNYILTAISHYSSVEHDTVKLVVRFTGPELNPISLPESVTVSVPDTMVSLTSRMPGYGFPENLSYFDDNFFTLFSRSDIGYVLTVAAAIQMDCANDNVYLVDSKFNQVVLRDSGFGGMYSLWYTTPVSFGAGDYGFQGSLQWSSFFHEMGHNTTLNFPAGYYFGGKIDGSSNAIYSETMAQIFAHSTAFEIINNYEQYGLDEILMSEIKISALSSMKIVRQFYDQYLGSGNNFASWNDPLTPNDETINTFMTIAYKFFEHAEKSRSGYIEPLKRMMHFLENFDETWETNYDRHNNSVVADTFRATMMATALDYAFIEDLRTEFRELNFPISDKISNQLLGYTGMGQENEEYLVNKYKLKQNFPNPFNSVTQIKFELPEAGFTKLKIYNNNGQLIRTLISEPLKAGEYKIEWNGMDRREHSVPSGIYFCHFNANRTSKTIKICLMK
jgi:hypothetical protein